MNAIRNMLFIPLIEDTACPANFDDVVDFAESTGAALTIFDSVPDLTKAERDLTVGLQPSATRLARSALRAAFAEWAAPFCERVQVHVDVAIGRRPLQISQQVKRQAHDLVIVAPGPSSFNHSIIRRLLRVCPCAVLVLRSPITAANVVVALDPFDPIEFNRSILDIACAHVRRSGGCLHVVHAWTPAGHHTLISATSSADVDTSQTVRGIESDHREALDKLLEELLEEDEAASATVHIDQGPAAAAILDRAANCMPALIVIGSCGPHGTETLVVGKTTEQLITSAASSVLIVHHGGR